MGHRLPQPHQHWIRTHKAGDESSSVTSWHELRPRRGCLRFRGQENDWTFARRPDGGEYWDYATPRGRDAANPPPPPRVVISEFLYHTGFVTNLADPGLLEYLELYNAANVPMPMFNETGLWRLAGGWTSSSPEITLGGGGRWWCRSPRPHCGGRCVSRPYAVPATTRLFRTVPVASTTTPTGSPWDDRLPGARRTVGVPLTGHLLRPRTLVGWAQAATDEAAPSLADRTAAGWFAAVPSPGRESAAPAGDDDADGMPNDWERLHDLNPSDPDDASQDPDQDGLTNLEEYRAGTNPHEHSVSLAIRDIGGGMLEFTFLAPAGKQTGISRRWRWGHRMDSGRHGAPAQSDTRERTVTTTAPLQATESGARFYRVRIW
jgi:hypothetical protein